MTKEEIIAEARRLFEHNGTLEIPLSPEVVDSPYPEGTPEPGAWVQAWVHVPGAKLEKRLLPISCSACGAPIRKFATGEEIPCQKCDGLLCEKCCDRKSHAEGG